MRVDTCFTEVLTKITPSIPVVVAKHTLINTDTSCDIDTSVASDHVTSCDIMQHIASTLTVNTVP